MPTFWKTFSTPHKGFGRVLATSVSRYVFSSYCHSRLAANHPIGELLYNDFRPKFGLLKTSQHQRCWDFGCLGLCKIFHNSTSEGLNLSMLPAIRGCPKTLGICIEASPKTLKSRALFQHEMPKWQLLSACQSIPFVSSSLGVQKEVWMTNKRHHMGHSHHHHDHQQDMGGKGERVARLGLYADIALAAGKAAAGYISGSTAIIADAAHSVSDVVLSMVALWSLKVARAPKDKEHPYGHGKFETLGALGISSMLLVTGGGIAWHAFEVLQAVIPSLNNIDIHSMADSTQNLILHGQGHGHEGHHHGIDMEHQGVALSAAIASIGVKEGLFWITKSVGDIQGSQLLKANAWHHRSDAISSIVALIGVGGGMLGLPFLDPLAGILVSGMIVRAGIRTGFQSLQELVDKGSPESELTPIRKTALSVQGVEGCHNLRGRRAGSSLYVDAHVEVDPWLSVSAAHNIGEAVRSEIQEKHKQVAETYVHIEPAHRSMPSQVPKRSLQHPNGEFSPTHLKEEKCANKKELNLEPNVEAYVLQADGLVNGTKARQQTSVEREIRHVIACNFSEEIKLRNVTCHFLEGKVIVVVEVCMKEDLLISDAIRRAKEVERSLLDNIGDISSVKMQLRLENELGHKQ